MSEDTPIPNSAPAIMVGDTPLSGGHSAIDAAVAIRAAIQAAIRAAGPEETIDLTDDLDLYERGLLPLSRASSVLPALLSYARRTRAVDQPIESVVRDLLTDLAHLADQFDDQDYGFIDLFERAHATHNRERAGEL